MKHDKSDDEYVFSPRTPSSKPLKSQVSAVSFVEEKVKYLSSRYPFLTSAQVKRRAQEIWKKKVLPRLSPREITEIKKKSSKKKHTGKVLARSRRNLSGEVQNLTACKSKHENFVRLNVNMSSSKPKSTASIQPGILKRKTPENPSGRRVRFCNQLDVNYKTSESSFSSRSSGKEFQSRLRSRTKREEHPSSEKATRSLIGNPALINFQKSKISYSRKASGKKNSEDKFDFFVNSNCSWSYKSEPKSSFKLRENRHPLKNVTNTENVKIQASSTLSEGRRKSELRDGNISYQVERNLLKSEKKIRVANLKSDSSDSDIGSIQSDGKEFSRKKNFTKCTKARGDVSKRSETVSQVKKHEKAASKISSSPNQILEHNDTDEDTSGSDVGPVLQSRIENNSAISNTEFDSEGESSDGFEEHEKINIAAVSTVSQEDPNLQVQMREEETRSDLSDSSDLIIPDTMENFQSDDSQNSNRKKDYISLPEVTGGLEMPKENADVGQEFVNSDFDALQNKMSPQCAEMPTGAHGEILSEEDGEIGISQIEKSKECNPYLAANRDASYANKMRSDEKRRPDAVMYSSKVKKCEEETALENAKDNKEEFKHSMSNMGTQQDESTADSSTSQRSEEFSPKASSIKGVKKYVSEEKSSPSDPKDILFDSETFSNNFFGMSRDSENTGSSKFGEEFILSEAEELWSPIEVLPQTGKKITKKIRETGKQIQKGISGKEKSGSKATAESLVRCETLPQRNRKTISLRSSQNCPNEKPAPPLLTMNKCQKQKVEKRRIAHSEEFSGKLRKTRVGNGRNNEAQPAKGNREVTELSQKRTRKPRDVKNNVMKVPEEKPATYISDNCSSVETNGDSTSLVSEQSESAYFDTEYDEQYSPKENTILPVQKTDSNRVEKNIMKMAYHYEVSQSAQTVTRKMERRCFGRSTFTKNSDPENQSSSQDSDNSSDYLKPVIRKKCSTSVVDSIMRKMQQKMDAILPLPEEDYPKLPPVPQIPRGTEERSANGNIVDEIIQRMNTSCRAIEYPGCASAKGTLNQELEEWNAKEAFSDEKSEEEFSFDADMESSSDFSPLSPTVHPHQKSSVPLNLLRSSNTIKATINDDDKKLSTNKKFTTSLWTMKIPKISSDFAALSKGKHRNELQALSGTYSYDEAEFSSSSPTCWKTSKSIYSSQSEFSDTDEKISRKAKQRIIQNTKTIRKKNPHKIKSHPSIFEDNASDTASYHGEMTSTKEQTDEKRKLSSKGKKKDTTAKQCRKEKQAGKNRTTQYSKMGRKSDEATLFHDSTVYSSSDKPDFLVPSISGHYMKITDSDDEITGMTSREKRMNTVAKTSSKTKQLKTQHREQSAKETHAKKNSTLSKKNEIRAVKSKKNHESKNSSLLTATTALSDTHNKSPLTHYEKDYMTRSSAFECDVQHGNCNRERKQASSTNEQYKVMYCVQSTTKTQTEEKKKTQQNETIKFSISNDNVDATLILSGSSTTEQVFSSNPEAEKVGPNEIKETSYKERKDDEISSNLSLSPDDEIPQCSATSEGDEFKKCERKKFREILNSRSLSLQPFIPRKEPKPNKKVTANFLRDRNVEQNIVDENEREVSQRQADTEFDSKHDAVTRSAPTRKMRTKSDLKHGTDQNKGSNRAGREKNSYSKSTLDSKTKKVQSQTMVKRKKECSSDVNIKSPLQEELRVDDEHVLFDVLCTTGRIPLTSEREEDISMLKSGIKKPETKPHTSSTENSKGNRAVQSPNRKKKLFQVNKQNFTRSSLKSDVYSSGVSNNEGDYERTSFSHRHSSVSQSKCKIGSINEKKSYPSRHSPQTELNYKKCAQKFSRSCNASKPSHASNTKDCNKRAFLKKNSLDTPPKEQNQDVRNSEEQRISKGVTSGPSVASSTLIKKRKAENQGKEAKKRLKDKFMGGKDSTDLTQNSRGHVPLLNQNEKYSSDMKAQTTSEKSKNSLSKSLLCDQLTLRNNKDTVVSRAKMVSCDEVYKNVTGIPRTVLNVLNTGVKTVASSRSRREFPSHRAQECSPSAVNAKVQNAVVTGSCNAKQKNIVTNSTPLPDEKYKATAEQCDTTNLESNCLKDRAVSELENWNVAQDQKTKGRKQNVFTLNFLLDEADSDIFSVSGSVMDINAGEKLKERSAGLMLDLFD